MSTSKDLLIQESLMAYPYPDLLQLASYLAQHDVAFNKFAQNSTEGTDDQIIESTKKVAPEMKRELCKNSASSQFPPRTDSPPTRDIKLSSSQRKPLHAPTERQLKAAKVSHLMQLINKSKAALLNLDSEIVVESGGLNIPALPIEGKVLLRNRLPMRSVTPGGVLKPCVRTLNVKGTRKGKVKRSASVRWVNETVNTKQGTSSHRARSKPSRDTNVLSSYLKRLAVSSSFKEPIGDVQKVNPLQALKPREADSSKVDISVSSSNRHSTQPGLVDFLAKWEKAFQLYDMDTPKRSRVWRSGDQYQDEFLDSSSTSTDSIGVFIRNHTKQKVTCGSRVQQTSKTQRTRQKSPKTPQTKHFPREKAPLKTIRLAVEQHRQLLADSRAMEVAQKERWRRCSLLSTPIKDTISLSQLSDWLAEEIVDACMDASANFIDYLSEDVINGLFRHELASSSSSCDKFCDLLRTSQIRESFNLQSILRPNTCAASAELESPQVAPRRCLTDTNLPKHANSFVCGSSDHQYMQSPKDGNPLEQKDCGPVLESTAFQRLNTLSLIVEETTISSQCSKIQLNQPRVCSKASNQFRVENSLARITKNSTEIASPNEGAYNGNYNEIEDDLMQKRSDYAASPSECNVTEEKLASNSSTGAYADENIRSRDSSENLLVQINPSAISLRQSDQAEETSIPVECITPRKASSSLSKTTHLSEIYQPDLNESPPSSSSVRKDYHYRNLLSGDVSIIDGKKSFDKENQELYKSIPNTERSLDESSVKLDSTNDGQGVQTSTLESNESPTTEADRSVTLPITSEGISSPRPVRLHKRAPSLDLISSLKDASIPDISTPSISITPENSPCDSYEDDFEPSEDSN